MSTDVTGALTAAGTLLVAWQLWLARSQLTGEFEQQYVDRYVEIIRGIDLDVLLCEDDEVRDSLRSFYDYFELCEEELYYRRTGKVSRRTWNDWWEGMRLHFRRPAFRRAWDELSRRATVTVPVAGSAVRTEQFRLLRDAVRAMDDGRAHDPRPMWSWLLRLVGH